MNQLRIAVVGCGAAGRFHCEAIADAVPELKLTAVVDAMPEIGGAVAQKYGVPLYADCAQLIAANACDAVTIATPHPVHATPAVACMNAGLHVLTEKPLAESVAAGDLMLKAAARHQVVFGCIFQRRYEQLVIKALELVRSGRLGNLLRATLIFRDFRTQTYYDSNVWRATWKGEGGGVLLNQAPHWLDLFSLLAGRPATVRGRLGTRLHQIEVEDHAEALLTFPNGATGYVLCTTNEPLAGSYIEIAGTRGRMLLRDAHIELTEYDVDLAEFAAGSPEMWGRPQATTVPVPVDLNKVSHFSVLGNFARHLLHGEPLLCDAHSALASLELANAITLSHCRGGREVKLPISRAAYSRQLAKLQAGSKTEKQNVRLQFTTDPRMK